MNLRCMLGWSLVIPTLAQSPGQDRPPADALKGNASFFRRLDSWPTPTDTRAASGAPGHRYWQQKVDYKIKATLDDATQTITGVEEITYHNASPDALTYLWLQLDQNLEAPGSVGRGQRADSGFGPYLSKEAAQAAARGARRGVDPTQGLSFKTFERLTARGAADGFHLREVKDAQGRLLHTALNDTMLRVDLPEPLRAGQTFKFGLAWSYTIPGDKTGMNGRNGFEQMEDGTRLYNIAQWQPRLCAYTDDMGWQHQQFLGSGEFTLEFGDWDVELTVPRSFLILATGELQNAPETLTAAQRDRLAKARQSDKPLFIVTPEEAGQAGTRPAGNSPLTWKFKAHNVRDFAWTAGPRLIWDAQGVKVNDRTVMAMSSYTKEGLPLWPKYSTAAVAHTLRVYGRYTFDYPYPVAISALGVPNVGGMEYPMICFNSPRPEKDGTYSERTKQGLIGVVIHEVGHNFFPMIVNSDERQWTWMDEGLNTFLQYLSEKEWDPGWVANRGPVRSIVDYLRFPDATPIMTQSAAVKHMGFNAYAKPAAGLNFLRETVMGRELFDHAFKTYAQRWKFKRPQPADFFRTLADASGMDLDWFWRGWFYTTLAPDLAVEHVEAFRISGGDPAEAKAREKTKLAELDQSQERQRDLKTIPGGGEEKRLGLQDFYTDGTYNRFAPSANEQQRFEAFLKGLSDQERKDLAFGKTLTKITIRNVGRFPLPVILKVTTADGAQETVRIPVQAWMANEDRLTKVHLSEMPVVSVELDPLQELPDVDPSNNAFPRKLAPPEPLTLRKEQPMPPNPMQERAKAEAAKEPKP